MAKIIKPERDLTINEVRQALAVGLRDKVNAVAEKFKDLKQREVQKLGKHELCPLCGNADTVGSCTCLNTLSKSEGLSKKSPPGKFKDLPEKLKEKGYSADSAFAISWAAKNKADAKKTEPVEKNALMGYDDGQAGGGGGGMSGGAGMSMSEGEGMEKGEMCKGCGQSMAKEEKAPVERYLDGSVKEKAAQVHAFVGPKGACGADGCGKAQGHRVHELAKDEKKPDHKFEGKGKKLESDVKTCKECGKPFDLHKAEYKVEKCKTCGSTHKTGISYNHELVKEDDSNIPVDDPLGPDAVLPDDKKAKETGNDEGSGGEDSKLQKDAMGALMGGGKFAKPGSMPAPKLPGMTPKGGANPVAPAPTKVNGMHPDTHASLQGIKSMSPVVRANNEMSKFKSLASNPTAMPGGTLVNPKAMNSNTVSGKVLAKPAPAPAAAKPDALSQVRTQLNTDAKKPNDALQGVRDKMNLDADKKAGGVGWLNSLISRFKKPDASAGIKDQILRKPGGGTPVQAAPVQSSRFHGARPLVRSESFGTDLRKSLGNCVICGNAEHPGKCAPVKHLSSPVDDSCTCPRNLFSGLIARNDPKCPKHPPVDMNYVLGND